MMVVLPSAAHSQLLLGTTASLFIAHALDTTAALHRRALILSALDRLSRRTTAS